MVFHLHVGEELTSLHKLRLNARKLLQRTSLAPLLQNSKNQTKSNCCNNLY